MLRQPHRVGWSLPGGLLDRGESAAVAVVREVREELGLTIEVGRPVTVVVDSPLRRVDVIFGSRVDGEVSEKVGGEATTARWLRPQDVDEMDAPDPADPGRGPRGGASRTATPDASSCHDRARWPPSRSPRVAASGCGR